MPSGLDFLFTSNNYFGHFGYRCITMPTSIMMYMYIVCITWNWNGAPAGLPIWIATLPTFVLFDPPLFGVLDCLPLQH